MNGKILAFPADRRGRRLSIPTLAFAVLLCAASFMGMALYGDRIMGFASGAVETLTAGKPKPPVSLLSGGNGASTFAARDMAVCSGGYRWNCIVDGDTVWLEGTKIRIANIDAPEMQARCRQEAQWAIDVRQRLRVLLSGKTLTVRETGTDIYGRTLAVISTGQGDVGEKLVADDLAVTWTGHRAGAAHWCGTLRS